MTILKEERGAAERLLDLVLSSGAHLWHNRIGVDVNGVWFPRIPSRRAAALPVVHPGLFVPAAVALYGRLLDIYRLDPELAARFASYAITTTDWRDLHTTCAALMLVQPRAGQPVREEDGTVAFHDDDYRTVGEAMVLRYVSGSTRMMTPKGILRIAQLLETPQIALPNRAAGFADPAGTKAPLGRWPAAARQWLASRESNLPLLEGLVTAGYKETLKKLARKCGYKPQSARFFEILGWPQKQAAGGHRQIGLEGLQVRRRERFDGLTEAEICARIATERLSYKDVVGRLPGDLGLTPAIMVALLPSLSDRDMRILTPTLESLGLLEDEGVHTRWEKALAAATDLRSLNVARNVRDEAVREKLDGAAAAAIEAAVTEAIADEQVHVMFLIDKSGSMEGAIAQSKETLIRILAGFPVDRLHMATFDTMGRVLRPKAVSRTGVAHMLDPVQAGGGTVHASGVQALRAAGVRVPGEATLVVIVVGDEAGETGARFAESFVDFGHLPAAFALIVNVENPAWRGSTVRDAAAHLEVPYSEVEVAQFDDPYQVTRVLKALLTAPIATGSAMPVSRWLDAVLATPLLAKPSR
jgi:hypothetical protein